MFHTWARYPWTISFKPFISCMTWRPNITSLHNLQSNMHIAFMQTLMKESKWVFYGVLIISSSMANTLHLKWNTVPIGTVFQMFNVFQQDEVPRHVPTSKLRLFDTASLANLQKAFLQWLLTLLYMLHLASKANRTSWRWNIPHTLLCHSQSVTNRIKTNLLHLPICTLLVPWWLGEETNRPPSVHERQRSWPQHWRPKPPRSLEASKRWARGRCQFFLQQTELLHPVRRPCGIDAEAIHFISNSLL